MQVFLEGLTATHDAKFFLEEAERLGNPLRKGIRGNPLIQGRQSHSCSSGHPDKSCHWVEIGLREQGLHATYKWRHEG
jgi:hypothetical protein